MKKLRYIFTSMFFLLMGGVLYLAPELTKKPELALLLLCCLIASNYLVAYEASDE